MIESSDIKNPKSGIDTAERVAGRNPKLTSEARSSFKMPMGEPSKTGYKLATGVQVREESFGLLFYNYQGPRLYFVPSKDLIPDLFFDGQQSVSELVESVCSHNGWSKARIRGPIIQILKMLEERGLIDEQSIC